MSVIPGERQVQGVNFTNITKERDTRITTSSDDEEGGEVGCKVSFLFFFSRQRQFHVEKYNKNNLKKKLRRMIKIGEGLSWRKTETVLSLFSFLE